MEHEEFTVTGLTAGYRRSTVLHGVDLTVPPGQAVAVLGPNGAGKSTLLGAISGLVDVRAGSIRLGSTDLRGKSSHAIVRLGVVHVPQGRRVFPEFTVTENLRAASYVHGSRTLAADTERVFEAFPSLARRRSVRAGLLSGGEQQMLAVARAVVQRPRLLLIDEMSLGLAPIVVGQLYAQLPTLFPGVPALIVEQNPGMALRHCSSAYVLSSGRVVTSGSVEELSSTETLMDAYVGANHTTHTSDSQR